MGSVDGRKTDDPELTNQNSQIEFANCESLSITISGGQFQQLQQDKNCELRF